MPKKPKTAKGAPTRAAATSRGTKTKPVTRIALLAAPTVSNQPFYKLIAPTLRPSGKTKGALTLRARPAQFEPKSQPSFVGRRQQHRNFSASTSLTYVPAKDGDKAGIVAFQNDKYYYMLSLTRVHGRTMVQVEKHAGAGVDSVVASVQVPVNDNTPLFLKIEGRGGSYDFSYATRPGEWNLLLAKADGTILSTKVAAGFVGAMVGLYAYSPEN